MATAVTCVSPVHVAVTVASVLLVFCYSQTTAPAVGVSHIPDVLQDIAQSQLYTQVTVDKYKTSSTAASVAVLQVHLFCRR